MEKELQQLKKEIEELKKVVFKLPLDPNQIGTLNQGFIASNFDKFNVTNLHLKTGNEIEPSVNGQVVYNENAGTPHIQAMIDDVVVDLDGGGTGTITGTDTHILFFDGTDTPAGNAGLTFDKVNYKVIVNGSLTLDGTNNIIGMVDDSGDIELRGADSSAGGLGGFVNINGGTGDAGFSGGGIVIQAGFTGAGDVDGVGIDVYSASGNGNGAGGDIFIGGGSGSGTEQGGGLEIDMGNATDVLGTELVTNGTFTGSATGWTLGAGWAYNSNNVLHTAGNTADLSQAISISDSEVYRVVINVGGSAGSVDVKVGSTGTPVTIAAGAGTLVYSDTAGVGVATLYITPTTDFNGTIDSVSVKTFSGGGNGGDILLYAGDSGMGGTGGTISLTPGAGVNNNSYGGSLNLRGGSVSGTGDRYGGNVNIVLPSGAGAGTSGRLNITGLPTSSAGLATGDIWLNSNVLTIVP